MSTAAASRLPAPPAAPKRKSEETADASNMVADDDSEGAKRLKMRDLQSAARQPPQVSNTSTAAFAWTFGERCESCLSEVSVLFCHCGYLMCPSCWHESGGCDYEKGILREYDRHGVHGIDWQETVLINRSHQRPVPVLLENADPVADKRWSEERRADELAQDEDEDEDEEDRSLSREHSNELIGEDRSLSREHKRKAGGKPSTWLPPGELVER